MFKNIAKFFLYASVFSVIIVLSSTFFPFIGGKYYFFRVCVELAVAALALWWGFEAGKGELMALVKETFKKPLVIAVSVFVLMFMLSTLFAYNPRGAFWSNYERGEGGFQMLHYYAYFLLMTMLFKEAKQWRLYFKLFLGAAVLMCLYGVMAAGLVSGFVGQYSSIGTSLLSRLFSPTMRFQGSLGNAAYVAPYLMFAMFFALYLWMTGNIKSWQRVITYWALIVFYVIFFVLSQTRGAFLGVVAGVFAFIAYLVLTNKRFRMPGIIAIVALAALGGILFNYRNTPAIKSLPGSRFLQIDFQETTFKTRFWTWGTAIKGFKERPILGWGPENFSAVFDKYFDSRHYIPGQNTETWFDRAHSVFFGYLTDTGILGLASYLAIFGIFYWEFYKRKLNWSLVHTTTPLILSAAFFALPIAYLVQGLALFDVLPIYMGLFASLSVSAWLLNGSVETKKIGK